jgi:hypothetical protein
MIFCRKRNRAPRLESITGYRIVQRSVSGYVGQFATGRGRPRLLLAPRKKSALPKMLHCAEVSQRIDTVGHSGPAGRRSGHVRYAPKATVGHQNAIGRDGPIADIAGLLDHLVGDGK